MVNDVDIARARAREFNLDPSSLSPPKSVNSVAPDSDASSSNGTATITKEPSPKTVPMIPSSYLASETSATTLLAAIRSTNNGSDDQHKRSLSSGTTNATSIYGYLASSKATVKPPSTVKVVQEELLVIAMPTGDEAIAYGLSAIDESGHRDPARLGPSPGPSPGLPINAESWLTFQRSDFGSHPELPKESVSLAITVSDSSDDGPRFSSVSDEIKTTEDTTWIKQDADLDDVWMIKKTPSLTASNQGQDSDLGDANARKTPRIILASNQERDSNSRRLDNRHFVHIRDDAPSKILIKNREQHRNGRRGHDSEDQEEDRGEHKKTERRHSVIVKAVDEWRCLETEAGRGTDQPNIQKLVCPPGLMITSFGLASVGNPKGSCQGQDSRQPGSCHVDLSKILQSRCAGKSVCDIDSLPLAVDEIRNQCRNQTRPADVRAVIEYQCSPWVSNPILANSTLDHCQTIENNGTLQCPQGQAILGFGFGFYGEIDGSCSKGISPGICSRNVMTDLTTQCVGRNQCRVDMGSTPFGSACRNNATAFSLSANFKCGLLSNLVTNSTKIANQSYVSGNLHFAKGNGAISMQAFTSTLIVSIGITLFIM